MAMQVILREEVDNLGIPGDLVNVAPGYARNYLLPRNLAVPATEANKKIVAQQREAHLRKEVSRISEAEELKKMMGELKLTFQQKAGDNDQLFGSVTAQDIVVALEKEGYKLERRQVRLHEPIKMLGDYTVTVRLHREVLIDVPVTVLNEDGTPAGAKQAALEAATAGIGRSKPRAETGEEATEEGAVATEEGAEAAAAEATVDADAVEAVAEGSSDTEAPAAEEASATQEAAEEEPKAE